MKILMTPIEVLAHFETDGTPHPLRFKLNGKELKIKQVLSVTEEKLAGSKNADLQVSGRDRWSHETLLNQV